MPDSEPILTVAPVELSDSASITSIRLVTTPEGVQVISSVQTAESGFPKYRLKLRAGSPNPLALAESKTLFSIPQLLPALISWDVSYSTSETAYHCVVENPGGAINALLLYDQKGNTTTLSAAYPLQSFSKPRLVRNEHRGGRPSVSALVDNKSLVVFPGAASENEPAYIRIGDWDDGLLIATAKGYILFAKRDVGGPARDGILPGILNCVRLNEEFHVVQDPIQPFGSDVLIYEFDADLVSAVLPHECFVIAATGPNRTIVSHSEPLTGSLIRVPLKGQFNDNHVTRPAIAAVKDEVSVAFVEAIKTKEARVWIGSISLKHVITAYRNAKYPD